MCAMAKLVNPNARPVKPPLSILRERAGEVADHLGLMSNANRLMVLCHLLDGEQSVGELQAQIELSQSALSQHLAKLREAGLVSTRRERQTIHYRIADPRVREMIDALYRIYCLPE